MADGRVDADVARRRDEQPGQDLQQRRLADAVGADDAEAGVGPDGERHAVEDGVPAALVTEVAGDQCRRAVRRWEKAWRAPGTGAGRRDGDGRRSQRGAAAGRVELYITRPAYRLGLGSRAGVL